MAEITITEEELSKLIDKRVSSALKEKKSIPNPKKSKNHTVFLRQYGEGYIVATDGANDVVKKDNGSEELFSTYIINTNGKESKKKLGWDEVRRLPRVEFDITKNVVDNKEETYGHVEVVEYGEKREIHTGRYVESLVVTPEAYISVMLGDGKEIEVDSRIINI